MTTCFLIHFYFSGTIESHELKLVLANLGEILTDEELHEMIKKLDKDGDGEIDFEEFVGLMKLRAQERNERDPEEELRDAFNIFDADGSGFIDRNEVRLLMKKLAQDLTDEGEYNIVLYVIYCNLCIFDTHVLFIRYKTEIDSIMEEADVDGDGEISWEEFKAIMFC